MDTGYDRRGRRKKSRMLARFLAWAVSLIVVEKCSKRNKSEEITGPVMIRCLQAAQGEVSSGLMSSL
jgi:hypothetical protein